jgi:hypothetical protein
VPRGPPLAAPRGPPTRSVYRCATRSTRCCVARSSGCCTTGSACCQRPPAAAVPRGSVTEGGHCDISFTCGALRPPISHWVWWLRIRKVLGSNSLASESLKSDLTRRVCYPARLSSIVSIMFCSLSQISILILHIVIILLS